MPEKIIEIKDNDIDVKEIMAEIRENIRKRNIQNISLDNNIPLENVDLNQFSIAELQEHLKLVNNLWSINPEMKITSHRKIIGPVIVFFKHVLRKISRWYVQPIVAQQNHFNSEVVRTLNEMNGIIEQKTNINEQLKDSVNALIEEINNIRKQMVNMDDYNNIKLKSLEDSVESNYSKIDELEEKVNQVDEHSEGISVLEEKVNQVAEQLDQSVNEVVEQVSNSIEEKAENIMKLKETIKKTSRIDDIESKLFNVELNLQTLNGVSQKWLNSEMVTNARIRRMEKRSKENPIDDSAVHFSVNQNNTEHRLSNDDFEFDYFMFESLYRGSRSEIKEKQKVYLDLFNGKGDILDIGCGRGEFIELLLEKGIQNVKGIDINEDMVDYCQSRGMNVELIDAFDYLNAIDDNSLNGIFMAQVIEHLTPSQIIHLVKLAHAKLRTTGVLIMETINPQTLSVFANSFYMDMTHDKLIHPKTIEFIVQTEGFNEIDTMYLSPASYKLPLLNVENAKNLSEFNAGIHELNQLLFGNQDYAIVAKK